MPPTRLVLAHVMIAAVLGASAYDILTGREHWPASPYPMFAMVERSETLDRLRVYGVTDEATPREFPLLDRALIAPFDQTRLSTALARAAAGGATSERVQQMLRDCLRRYERLRVNGEHTGPALRAIRLYDVHWTLDAHAANVDAPDSRRLVAEFAEHAAAATN